MKKGETHSQEVKDRMRALMTAVSEETRQKMVAARKAWWERKRGGAND